MRDAKRPRASGRSKSTRQSSTKKKRTQNKKRASDDRSSRFGFMTRLIFMMVLGFLMVWTYDLVSRTMSENEQMEQLWDKVVMRFLDEDLPGLPKAKEPQKKAVQAKPVVKETMKPKTAPSRSRQHAKPPPRPVPTTGNDLTPTRQVVRGDLPTLSPEEYARQSRLRRASSTKAEREQRHSERRDQKAAAVPKTTHTKPAPQRTASPVVDAQPAPAKASPVEERVARTRQALNAIIQSVTGQ